MMTRPRFADYREHVDAIYAGALAAVDPYESVRREINWVRASGQLTLGARALADDKARIWLVAAGKAAIPMARAAAEQLGKRLHQGVVIYKNSTEPPDDFGHSYPHLKLYPAAHPVSDESSVAATLAARDLLQQTRPNDVVLCLVSGGCSALLTAPRLSLPEWQTLNRALLAAGCSIHTFNRIRQQLDAVKGGGLLHWAAPAPVVGLILSDVIGDDLRIIGSGPTVPAGDRPEVAAELLRHYKVYSQLEPALAQKIQSLLTGRNYETQPTVPEPANYLVANLKIAAAAAQATAAELGFQSHCLTTRLEGEAGQMGRFAAALAVDASPGQALILGGEATVIVRGSGRGGRNQELALAAIPTLDQASPVVLAALATDGEDRLNGVAGAIATHRTGTKVRALALDVSAYLADNDSFTFWRALGEAGDPFVGGLVERAPTGTNVNDLLIILRYEA